ncbi:hypothetical protein ACUWCL_28505, partial [Klebsiella pneumoniae]|uniref:hypothetical protein n=1 Tax=Klebsiella pneumoniae TaxID=573 RepID=UPI004055813E
ANSNLHKNKKDRLDTMIIDKETLTVSQLVDEEGKAFTPRRTLARSPDRVSQTIIPPVLDSSESEVLWVPAETARKH